MKIITILTALAANPVMAQQKCAPHAEAIAMLAQNYAESREMVALSADGLMVEVFASESGSWTLIATNAQGISCLVGAGEAYQYVDDPLPPLGDEG